MFTIRKALAAALLSLLAASAYAQGKTEVVWLGNAAFRITTPGGKVIVVDPFITANPKTPPEWKNLDALGKVDLIPRHARAPGPLPRRARAREEAQRADVGPGGPGRVGGGARHPSGPSCAALRQGRHDSAVRAERSQDHRDARRTLAGVQWRNPATGKDEIHVGGEPVGYVIEMENGFEIYHMGDTGLRRPEADRRALQARPAADSDRRALRDEPEGRGRRDARLRQAALRDPDALRDEPVPAGMPQEYWAAGNAPVKVFTLNPGEKVDF